MKLVRIKITDPAGFRSLPCGFEHHFRSEWSLQKELASNEGFAPFVCAGPNGGGKSNLLEVLGAIFYQLEIQRVRRSFLPEALQSDERDLSPTAFELDYLIRMPEEYRRPDSPEWAKVEACKKSGETVRFRWENQGDFDTNVNEVFGSGYADIILPQYVLGYSSGENEILSLPFFKMRFIQFDEYWNSLSQQLPYPGYPETRMAYLDNSFSQAILLCNLLLQDEATLQPFRENIGIETLKEFRIILRRRIELTPEQLESFSSSSQSPQQTRENMVKNHPAIIAGDEEPVSGRHQLNVLHLLEGDEHSSRIISALQRCATLSYEDDANDCLILDYWVNAATQQAFRENFEGKPLSLFQSFQVLLSLNLYTVSDTLKADLYQSNSHYVSETVPLLASDQRIMRFKFVRFSKNNCDQPLMLKELSDGEHQLLHSLGLCLLFRNTNSLILLDEPETHFNPSWRANFISQLKACLGNCEKTPEMLITTHSPFLISDSKPNKVLEFEKDPETRHVKINHPDYNTFGASINKITMKTFNKRETIGGQAQTLMDNIRARFERGEEATRLIDELDRELGDSVEKILLIKAMLDISPENGAEVQG